MKKIPEIKDVSQTMSKIYSVKVRERIRNILLEFGGDIGIPDKDSVEKNTNKLLSILPNPPPPPKNKGKWGTDIKGKHVFHTEPNLFKDWETIEMFGVYKISGQLEVVKQIVKWMKDKKLIYKIPQLREGK